MIRTIQKQTPGMDAGGNYQVHSPDHQETYIFNKFGLHMETRNMATKETVYKFAYSVSTSSGVLVSVTDFAGGKVSILRNYAGQVEAIKNPQGDKFMLTVDRKHLLRSFAYNANNSVQFMYDRSKELLRSRTEPDGNSQVYNYDRNGRLEKVVMPTGEVINLASDISIDGAIVNITRNEHTVSLLIQKSFVQKTSGSLEQVEVIQKESDTGFTVQNKWGHKVVIHTSPYLLLEQSDNTPAGLAESFPIASAEQLLTGRESLNRLSWEYYSSEANVPAKYAKLGKKLIVNGQAVYNVELLTEAGQQFISADVAAKRVVNITRNSSNFG
jgi:YD repeat-containing protein